MLQVGRAPGSERRWLCFSPKGERKILCALSADSFHEVQFGFPVSGFILKQGEVASFSVSVVCILVRQLLFY